MPVLSFAKLQSRVRSNINGSMCETQTTRYYISTHRWMASSYQMQLDNNETKSYS